MKKRLLTLATAITSMAAGTSFYLSTLPNLTEAQMSLANTANIIIITGTNAIFILLNDEDENSKNS